MPNPKLTVGQKLFSLNVGNAARRGTPQVLTPVVVTKVGRKYFTVTPVGKDARCWEMEYHIEDWRERTEYTPNSQLYATEQEWLDEHESEVLSRRIYQAFEYGNNRKHLSVETLRTISALIPD